ncbi:unnamed protein product, partial [Rotaria sp. Silwood2]
MKPIYHQICSSDFVSSAWISFLLGSQFIDYVLYSNYRVNFGTQFRLLNTFCESVQETIDDALRGFLQT